MGKVWKPVPDGTYQMMGPITEEMYSTIISDNGKDIEQRGLDSHTVDSIFLLDDWVLCTLVPDEGSVPSVVWVVYRTDGYHPSNVAYFTSEDEAKKCAEWSRADEVKRYQEIGLEESYVDDYGVYSMPLNTTFDAWLTQQQKGGE